MEKNEIEAIAVSGEDSRLQFKQDIRNADALASEMVAFSNSEGAVFLLALPIRENLEEFPESKSGGSIN